MKNTLNLILLILLPFWCLHGQSNAYRDSLLATVQHTQADEQIAVIKEYAHHFYKTEPQQVVNLLDKSLSELSLSTLDSVDFYFIKGKSGYYLHSFKDYVDNLKKANQLLTRYDGERTPYFYLLRHQKHYQQGIQKLHEGVPQQALEFYLKALEDVLLSDDKLSIAQMYKTIGSFLIDQRDCKKAIKYLNNSLKQNLSKSDNAYQQYYARLYTELASAHIELNHLDSSKLYLDLIPPEEYTITTQVTIANYYHSSEEHIKALYLLDSLITKVNLEGPAHWIPFLKASKADNLYPLKRFEEAEKFWLDARMHFLETKDKWNIVRVNNNLYEYYKDRGQFEKALIYHEALKTLNDSIIYDNHSAMIEGIENTNALKLKEQENEQLKQQKLIHQATIRRQQIIGALLLGCMLLLSALVYNYFRSAATKKRLNEQLREANTDLAEKNRIIKIQEEEKLLQVQHTLQELTADYEQNTLEKVALSHSLTARNKELAAKMMQISKHNAGLENILDELKTLYRKASGNSKLKISKIINQLNDNLDIEAGWETFSIYFKEVHPSFIDNLQKHSSALSNNELRHCTFIKLGMTNREVAEMLNVSIKTVEVARYRIKKKLNLTKEDHLNNYIASIG